LEARVEAAAGEADSHLLTRPPVCGKRYKNRPGLSYHYTHTHLAEEEGEEHAERHALPFHRKNNHKREPKGQVWVARGPGVWGSGAW
jgi:hypothetical protein